MELLYDFEIEGRVPAPDAVKYLDDFKKFITDRLKIIKSELDLCDGVVILHLAESPFEISYNGVPPEIINKIRNCVTEQDLIWKLESMNVPGA